METPACTPDISDRTSREPMSPFPFLYLQILVLEELNSIPQSSIDNVFESLKNRCAITIAVRAAHTITHPIKIAHHILTTLYLSFYRYVTCCLGDSCSSFILNQ